MDRKRVGFVDHYAALGLEIVHDPSELSLRDINDAYKRVAKKYHPDKARGAAKESALVRFQGALQAVELLRDHAKRQKYDEEYRSWKREERRRAAEDERTKRMRDDLERRELESSLESKNASELDRLRRETASIAQSARSAASQREVRTVTLEQHLAFERDIVARAMAFPS